MHPEQNDDTFGFSQEEWEHCIKVLSHLKDKPTENPDNELLGSLITKIYKKAKKDKTQSLSQSARQRDLETIKATVIQKNANNGTSFYGNESAESAAQFSDIENARNCYCCQQPYNKVHFFYARLCPQCALENYQMRFENVDLTGRKVLLTGGRVKIGYATALRFLRNGATLVVTTRFPGNAMSQFAAEKDYENWKNRLTVYGLDLRNFKALSAFVAFYTARFDSLDIMVNNAAQTIRYNDAYYEPVIAAENKALKIYGNSPALIGNKTPVNQSVKSLEYGQETQNEVPLNRFGQPVDFREKTSWNSLLDEVPLQELLEVNLINQIAPYYLISELKPWMLRSSFAEKFIVNVTSSEGMFSYNKKTPYHPHTNMTKAALNMMTLTSAADFAKDNIYMSCVDVGWISTGARESLRSKQFETGYIPPLDSVDGASRILHPIRQGILGSPYSGILLKNYKVSDW